MGWDQAFSTYTTKRFRRPRGPAFGITFYALSKSGGYGAASMYDASSTGKRAQFAVADPRGARKEDCAYLFQRRS